MALFGGLFDGPHARELARLIVAVAITTVVAPLPGRTVQTADGGEVASSLEVTVDPYEGVDWERAGRHKANFHTHTTQSDGRMSPERVIDEYHQRGYTVLAITDHDRSTYPWQNWDRDPDALDMVAVPGNELSRHHHTLSLFSDFETDQRDLNAVLEQLADYSEDALAVICHPAMHWPRQYGPEPGLQIALAPPLRRITQGDFTIEAWFRTTDAGRNILLGNFSSEHAGALNLELHTENRVRLYVQPDQGGRTVDLNVAAGDVGVDTRDGNWHHLAGARRDGTVYLFLNGELVEERADTAGRFDLQGDSYYIGRDTRTGGTILDGDLDQVRLWTRALSDDEVAQLASGSAPGDEAAPAADGLLVQYTFETSDGAPVRESARVDAPVDDTAGHPGGPFHAVADESSPASYIGEVAEVLQAAGASSHAVSFRARDDVQDVPAAAVQNYVDLFARYDHLVGIEVLNGTRPLREYPLDRQLWDKLLSQLMPDRPVWGLATDDMHSMVHLGRDWVVFPAEDLDAESIRQAMIQGAFYFSSTRLHDPEQAAVERTPRIESIAHDGEAGSITVRATVGGQPLADDAYAWISEGQVVHTGPELNYDSAEGIGAYVRVEITGAGGTTYTNPFGFRAAASGK